MVSRLAARRLNSRLLQRVATKERIQLESTGERVWAHALRVFGSEGKECAVDLPTKATAEALKERGLQTLGLGE
jgi:hypothetical protein